MRYTPQKICILLVLLLSMTSSVCRGFATVPADNEYLDMDISQLMQVTITSVSKKPQALSDAAAAVYVITQEDIHRSGVTSIPEALRMAPGLQVARISSNKWAISSRGLNGFFSNKLLVMIDGRTVYTPAFSGTYWDMQTMLLEDIDRIEVIRGPGATMWGANAVNGVINIISKSTADTVGGIATAGAGTQEELLGGFRYGTAINSSTNGRGYLTYNRRDSFEMLIDGSDANDSWETVGGGFRFDGDLGKGNTWTIQGDVYAIDENQIVEPFYIPDFPYRTIKYDDVDGHGWNVLGRWERKLSATDALKFQAYYDCTDREEAYGRQTHKTVDLDLQYEKQLGERNNLTLGLGYRNINTTLDSSFQISMIPSERSDNLYSGFIQDVITLVPDRFWLTLGTKWEYNDFTGNELQPTGRVMWQPTDRQAIWASVSRAVRTPSQFDQSGSITLGVDPSLPPFPAIFAVKGSPEFDSEVVIAYEAGYRWFPESAFSFDLALFYNDYDEVLAASPDADPAIWWNSTFTNDLKGKSYGVELVADWQPRNWLKFVFSYTLLHLDFKSNIGAVAQGTVDIDNGSAPQHQLSLRGSVDLLENWQANIWLRYVSELDMASVTADTLGLVVDDYSECDLNLSWKPRKDLEVMLVGQNLLNSSHLEFVSEFFMMPVEVERSVYLKVLYHF